MVRVAAVADTAQSLAVQRIWCRPVVAAVVAVQLALLVLEALAAVTAALPAQIMVVVMVMAAAVALNQVEEPEEAVPIVLEMRVVLTKAVQGTMELAIQVEPPVRMAAARAATVAVAAVEAGTAEAEAEAIRAAAEAPVAEAGVIMSAVPVQPRLQVPAQAWPTAAILVIPAAELVWAVQAALIPVA